MPVPWAEVESVTTSETLLISAQAATTDDNT